MPPAVGSPIAVDTRERVSAPFPSESELSPTSPGRPSSSDNPIDSPLSTDERLLAMDPGQPGSHYGNARQLSPRRGLRALQGPSFDIFAQNEVDTQGPGQDLRHPDAGTTHVFVWLNMHFLAASTAFLTEEKKAQQELIYMFD